MNTITIPLKITDVEKLTDGKGISVFVVDGEAQPRILTLWRSEDDPDQLPQRLYLDGVIVPIRSTLEHTITDGLTSAVCAQDHRNVVKDLVDSIINPDYLKTIERALKSYKPSFEGARRKMAQEKLWDEKTPAD